MIWPRRNCVVWRGNKRGQVLVEVALVLPVVLLLFFALWQYLLFIQAHFAAQYAIFLGARSYAVRYSWDDEAATKAQAAVDAVFRAAAGGRSTAANWTVDGNDEVHGVLTTAYAVALPALVGLWGMGRGERQMAEDLRRRSQVFQEADGLAVVLEHRCLMGGEPWSGKVR